MSLIPGSPRLLYAGTEEIESIVRDINVQLRQHYTYFHDNQDSISTFQREVYTFF